MEKNKNNFKERVLRVVQNIPKGAVLSYKTVAGKAGNPKAARAVALIMSRNFDSAVPCHRVIRSDGSLGGYNRGGVKKKREILKREGYKGVIK